MRYQRKSEQVKIRYRKTNTNRVQTFVPQTTKRDTKMDTESVPDIYLTRFPLSMFFDANTNSSFPPIPRLSCFPHIFLILPLFPPLTQFFFYFVFDSCIVSVVCFSFFLPSVSVSPFFFPLSSISLSWIPLLVHGCFQ